MTSMKSIRCEEKFETVELFLGMTIEPMKLDSIIHTISENSLNFLTLDITDERFNARRKSKKIYVSVSHFAIRFIHFYSIFEE